MIKNAVRKTTKLYQTIWQDILWAVVTFISLFLVNYFDVLHLENRVADWVVPFIYIAFVIVVSIPIVFAVNLMWEIFTKLLSRSSKFDGPFLIQMTKPQFERALDGFVNKTNKNVLTTPRVLLGWRTLHRRKTEQERRLSSAQLNVHTDEIADADFIRLTRQPFRGLVLELTEKDTGLWVVVKPEGDRESITVTEKKKRSKFLLFRHVGWKNIPVNPKAQGDLLRWLKSLENRNLKETGK